MVTVTAKTLRDNLSQYLDRLEAGEEVIIIRHSEIIGSLKPTNSTATSNGPAIAARLARSQSFFAANAKLVPGAATAKDLYHQALLDKHGL